MPEPVPEARAILDSLLEVYRGHFGAGLLCTVVDGSAVKGDFLAGGSDLDVSVYLEESRFDEGGVLAAPLAIAVHRDLARIDVAPFRFVQCRPKRPRGAAGS